MWGSVSSHAHRLCPHCSSPGFKSWPGAVCCVSLPLSQSVLSLKTYKGQKNPNVLHSAQHTHTHKKIPMKKKVSAKKKCFQSASYMKKYIIQLVTIHVRKFIFSCIELSEIRFFHGWNSFFRTRQKNVGKFFIISMNSEKKKSRNVENKVKIQFREIPTFSEKKNNNFTLLNKWKKITGVFLLGSTL